MNAEVIAFPPHREAGADQAKDWTVNSSLDAVAFDDGVVLPFRAFYWSDSLADAWIAATALSSSATLLHEDPEFDTNTQSNES